MMKIWNTTEVRQQSKDIANHIRLKVRDEREKQASAFRIQKNVTMKKLQAQKLLLLQQQYQDCLDEVGMGHKQATMQSQSIRDINRNNLANGIEQLPRIWQKIQEHTGNYIEGMLTYFPFEMNAQHHHLSRDDMFRAIDITENGGTQTDAARALNKLTGRSIISRMWNRYREFGSPEEQHPGKLRVTTAAQDRFLCLKALRERTLSVSMLIL
ncbi:hypothetical protein ANN_17791 [Periplaneta americana]|uniref:Uncharacterized protein n=1 Tax=Periplaneta americana TaxID=6978 RepID=A0ABQ8SV62_PERAM|nr:hypothetical protein ANN_17791 [Periplaneta americana]